MGNNTNQKIVCVGNKRFKLGNIKEYGISTKEVLALNIYKEVKNNNRGLKAFLLGNTDYVPTGDYTEFEYKHDFYYNRDEVYKHFYDSNGKVYVNKNMSDKGISVNIDYLYITTYQGDNDVYYADNVIIGYGSGFDIYEKCKELDELFNANN